MHRGNTKKTGHLITAVQRQRERRRSFQVLFLKNRTHFVVPAGRNLIELDYLRSLYSHALADCVQSLLERNWNATLSCDDEFFQKKISQFLDEEIINSPFIRGKTISILKEKKGGKFLRRRNINFLMIARHRGSYSINGVKQLVVNVAIHQQGMFMANQHSGRLQPTTPAGSIGKKVRAA